MNVFSITVVTAMIFSPLASAMAFVITYGEYLRHYPDKKQPLRLAMEAALVTFAFFVGLSFLIGFLLEKILG